MIIHVIGLGLIGGSICKALKEYTTHTVYGADISYEILNRAKAQGCLLYTSLPEDTAVFIVLFLPVNMSVL